MTYLKTAFPTFSLRLNFGIKRISSFFRLSLRKKNKISNYKLLFLTNEVVNKNVKRKQYFADNQFHNIFKILDVLADFSFIPQLKQWAIIFYKHGIYKLPQKFSKDLRIRILGN